MAIKLTSRLQTPADSDGTRKDVHLITTEDEVIMDYDDAAKSRTLKTKFQEVRPVISKSQPQSTSFKSSFLWGKIIDTLPAYRTMTQNLANSKGTGVNTSLES